MSEPIQSIAQNNYILATQQVVSHDSSLSGNGTVGSPIGVVPGYNETVLWEGDTPVSACTFSESRINFERLRILVGPGNNVHYMEIPPYITRTVAVIGKGESNMWMQETLLGINDTGMSALSGKSINFGNFAATAATIVANTASNENRYVIHQVVGINRKAQ